LASARARARALRLRRQAQEVEAAAVEPVEEPAAPDDDVQVVPVPDEGETSADDTAADDAAAGDTAADDEPVDIDAPAEEAAETRSRRRLHVGVPLPTWKGVALFLAVLCTCALLAVSGYMIREHRQAERDAQLAAEYTAAGRQAVVTLMSLDFNKAEEGVQRIIDNSTGKFREDFQQQAETFAQVAQDSKVITEVTVNSAAVSTMTEDSANVLVSATTRVTNAAGANKDPRGWRLSVDLERDGDQVKMSRVEFVP
jgi:Mce-associated membrane protein